MENLAAPYGLGASWAPVCLQAFNALIPQLDGDCVRHLLHGSFFGLPLKTGLDWPCSFIEELLGFVFLVWPLFNEVVSGLEHFLEAWCSGDADIVLVVLAQNELANGWGCGPQLQPCFAMGLHHKLSGQEHSLLVLEPELISLVNGKHGFCFWNLIGLLGLELQLAAKTKTSCLMPGKKCWQASWNLDGPHRFLETAWKFSGNDMTTKKSHS